MPKLTPSGPRFARPDNRLRGAPLIRHLPPADLESGRAGGREHRPLMQTVPELAEIDVTAAAVKEAEAVT